MARNRPKTFLLANVPILNWTKEERQAYGFEEVVIEQPHHTGKMKKVASDAAALVGYGVGNAIHGIAEGTKAVASAPGKLWDKLSNKAGSILDHARESQAVIRETKEHRKAQRNEH